MSAFSGGLYATDPATLQNSVERYDPGLTANELSNEQKVPEGIPASNVIIINGKSAPLGSSAAANIKFMCYKIILVGNKVFATSELAKLYQDKLNKEITLADLEQIAKKITDYYRKNGYVLSQAIIPPQEITAEGSAKIQIVEGYINKVSVTGCNTTNVCKLIKNMGNM